jgi:hypothetical protein
MKLLDGDCHVFVLQVDSSVPPFLVKSHPRVERKKLIFKVEGSYILRSGLRILGVGGTDYAGILFAGDFQLAVDLFLLAPNILYCIIISRAIFIVSMWDDDCLVFVWAFPLSGMVMA